MDPLRTTEARAATELRAAELGRVLVRKHTHVPQLNGANDGAGRVAHDDLGVEDVTDC